MGSTFVRATQAARFANSESLSEVESGAFAERVQSILHGTPPKDVSTLFQQASELIMQLESDSRDNYVVAEMSLKPSRILRASLDHAEQCNGQSALCYACAVVVACSSNMDVVELLVDLSKVWLSNFLFIFRASGVQAQAGQPSRPSSLIGPPPQGILEAMLEAADAGSPNRERTERLLKRDGYRCVVDGSMSYRHPDVIANADVSCGPMEAARIIPRAIGRVILEEQSATHQSAVSTLSILKNYCGIPAEMLNNMAGNINGDDNGFILGVTVHRTFDKFNWTLVPVEGQNRYRVEYFGRNCHGLKVPWDEIATHIVEFKDDSNTGIDVPHRLYIRIHAAVACMLHISGAGNFLNELLRKYGFDDDLTAIPRFENLLRRVEMQILSEICHHTMHMGIHSM
ncbi:hypothetical protein BDN72DRAFT_848323 [Pluteus cervinus]|uniref:Uncharacterized protein n=1 Tax=Pluteus cervinus TaxID=181527 RepID=A0ACD3AAU5_9AGAR|nr:hypothetical protein BDN72DRAFT_848323 [Pluteus cervinus]